MAETKKKTTVRSKRYRAVILFLRDAGVAFLFVCLILITMFAYTGLWPPLVVVESDSMMHSQDNTSYIGAIDTGDLVLVKEVNQVSDVETYMDGILSGHKTYGDFGDVIVYKRGGLDASTPIIHRAMIYLELNPDGTSFTADSLREVPTNKWSTLSSLDTWDHLTSGLVIYNVGWNDLTVTIDIRVLLSSHRSGFVTKGDHNPSVDPSYTSSAPVDIAWVVGKARGEIPWFGLLKLWSTDTLGSPAPDNSVRNLWITVAIIVITPIVIDIALTFREKRKIAMKRAEYLRRSERELAEEKKAEVKDSGGSSSRPPR